MSSRRDGATMLRASGISLALLCLAVSPHPAAADGLEWCENCSTVYTQLTQYAKEAQSMVTQLQQYQTELQQYANMVTNTVALPSQIYSTVQGDIMQVQNLANAASLLSGNSGSLISRLQMAGAYANEVGNMPGNLSGQFTMYQTTLGNSLSTMGKTLGIQQGQEASNASLLASLQAHSASATGQMQAIQAGNELAHQTATQLLQIQTTLSTTAQLEATQMAVTADRQAMQDAAMAHFAQPPQPVTPGQQW